MKNFIIKMIIIGLLAFAGGFMDAFFKDRNINITYAIYFSIGYASCLICNWRWI